MAQTSAVEITPFVGYQAGGSASSFDGSLAILADVNYGGAVDVRVTTDTTLQLPYNRQETDVDIRINDIFETIRLQEGLVVDYYHFGGTVRVSAGTSTALLRADGWGDTIDLASPFFLEKSSTHTRTSTR